MFCNNFIFNFISRLKNLYGHFWQTPEGLYEYYLKLDGFYFCKRKKSTVIVIRVRHKRTIEIITVNDIVNDKEYLKELHPMDACIIGILANNDRNGIINKTNIGWTRMNRSKECHCLIKSEPILEVYNKYINQTGDEIIVLQSKFLNKKIELPTTELCKNQALIYALDSFQAISIGYDFSEALLRNNYETIINA